MVETLIKKNAISRAGSRIVTLRQIDQNTTKVAGTRGMDKVLGGQVEVKKQKQVGR